MQRTSARRGAPARQESLFPPPALVRSPSHPGREISPFSGRTPRKAPPGREISPFSGRTPHKTLHGREISPFSGRTPRKTPPGREISPFSGRTPRKAPLGREISPFSGQTPHKTLHGREISPFSGRTPRKAPLGREISPFSGRASTMRPVHRFSIQAYALTVWAQAGAEGFSSAGSRSPPELLLSDGRKPVHTTSSASVFPPPASRTFRGYSFQLKNKYN